VASATYRLEHYFFYICGCLGGTKAKFNYSWPATTWPNWVWFKPRAKNSKHHIMNQRFQFWIIIKIPHEDLWSVHRKIKSKENWHPPEKYQFQLHYERGNLWSFLINLNLFSFIFISRKYILLFSIFLCVFWFCWSSLSIRRNL